VILLDVTGVSAARPGRPLFADVSLTVSSGDRVAVVGLNGSGKSTLLRQLAGTATPESGVVRRGRGTRVVLLDQDAPLRGVTVGESVGDDWEAEAILDHLGFAGRLGTPTAQLSGGEAKRVALARALVEVGPPNESGEDVLLILDEPTNHLDMDAIAWLERRLANHQGGLLLVSHDRHLLDRTTTRIIEIDRGKPYVHDGGYAGYLEARSEREAQAARQEQVRKNLARTELVWLRRGAPARSTKPKARIESATALVEGRAQAAAREGALDLAFGSKRLGDSVIELHRVGHRYAADLPWLFRGVDLVIDQRERLGIVGPNGAGKSTLLDIIAGRLAPVAGTVATGSTVQLGVFDQRGTSLDPTMTVEQAVAGPTRLPDWEDARFLERFWFDGDARRAPIGLLSGGERRRLQLVLMLRAKPNVILLDEPTNDLDLDTLRVLEDTLEDWPGAVIAVSHDRAFLERTVADVLAIDDRHPGRRVPGGFGAWERARHLRSDQPARTSTDKPALPTAAKQPPRAAGARSTLARRLRDADKEVVTLTARRGRLLQELATAASDHVALRRLSTDLAALDAVLAAAEEHWLDLATEGDA